MSESDASHVEVERQVREAEDHVIRMINIIAELESSGCKHAAEEARAVMGVLQRGLELARERLPALPATRSTKRLE